MKKIFFHLPFIVIAGGTILSDYFQEGFLYLFKPLIMVWIGAYFLFYSRSIHKKIVQLTMGAFLFSWFGDIALMFSDKGMAFFATGIFFFLIAQLFYIVLFLKTISISGNKSFLKKQPYWLIAFIAYGLVFSILLYNQLDNLLRISIFIYISAILAMSAMALNRLRNGHPASFSLIFAGSLFFIASDSFIAINRFLYSFQHAGAFILFSYIIAQYLIMRGILKQYE
ncbi:YhhN-like protein [Tangfeifania diversioriginum]|uniref:YhhN-like protein n=1 Tax=Tangfeifania diversioriginum TaxID=1168035 RepID=A0A1M6PF78_9BACT|nr:lysoplasmalogenase [Tangfeifania diversioriginum]SHK06581.1 YhhN-like protein [Tangfeifania diversioriginum]